ncbi:IclR family transcriptional regulator [Neptunomonas sp.]|uniref:IclR family transcriptional regulator n=1 Tax=Neptunomonas sp. TaxID=1971898 RepID=UPI003564B69E
MENNEELKNHKNHGVKVISKAADILRVLKKDNKGLSLGKIAERVGQPRSTVQRIVNALLAEQLVMMTSAEGGLCLGPEIQSLASAGRIDIAVISRPILTELSEKTGETTDLAVFKGSHMLFVDQVEGSHRLMTRSSIGDTFTMSDTANGKATLALLDDDIAATLISRELRYNEVCTITTSDIIREIERIKTKGYALDINEHTEGISAIGTAFIGPGGTIYALSIPVPSSRFEKKKKLLIADILKATEALKAFF